MTSRRLRLSSSPNPGNSAENTPVHTPVPSQQSEREPTPEQSIPRTPNASLLATNECWNVGSMHSDGRLQIEVIAGLLEPSGKCSRAITDSIYERLEPTGFNWKAVSRETKDFYFEEFKAVTNGKYPTPADIYLLTHTKNNDKKTMINKKAEQVSKKIEELRAQRSMPIEGSSEPQPVDDDQLFFDAVGGLDKKNMLYGMGSLQSVIYGREFNHNTATSRYNVTNISNEDYQLMQAELQEMKNQVRELQEIRNQEVQDMRS